MAKFSMPSGGTGDSQRPTATTNSPNPTALMKSSGKASESKGTTSLGAAVSGVFDTAGVTVNQQLPTVKPVPFVPTPEGPGGNVASETPDISAANVIKQGDGSKPGRQEPKKGAVASSHRPAPGVVNVQNPAFTQIPKKGA